MKELEFYLRSIKEVDQIKHRKRQQWANLTHITQKGITVQKKIGVTQKAEKYISQIHFLGKLRVRSDLKG
jgi:hypothetical protein